MNKEDLLLEKIITYNYNNFGNEFGDTLVDLKAKYHKQKEILDKIKEYVKGNIADIEFMEENYSKDELIRTDIDTDYNTIKKLVELLEEIE